jgi:hypothetical protein
MSHSDHAELARVSRREMLYGLGASVGTVAFQALSHAEDAGGRLMEPLAPRSGHLRSKAKACIFLTMSGGPSHIDTFDPKPKLRDLHLSEFQRSDPFASAMASGKRYFVESPFEFRRVGACGIDMCEHWRHLPRVADDLCYYRGLQAESIDHPTANYHLNTGSRFGGDPAIGAWVTYGLGSPNQNLPGFIVLPEVAYPQGGAANWSNGFLPAHYQGTPLRPTGSPILDLTPPPGVTRETQRKNLDLLGELNRRHLEQHPRQQELAARMRNYELAFQMQGEVPGLVDLSGETQATQAGYGLGEPLTREFGRRCLLARRLIEQGVRFVQIYAAGWDSHDYIENAHSKRIQAVDQPIAALISDLKQRGLLESTLVVWTGEFGRSPDNGVRGGVKYGRDHNAQAMPIWIAGGGVRAGEIIGATDELGAQAVESVHPLRDMHVTLLRLLGLDDNKLTYFHGGRFKQLSQTGGSVIHELLG